MPGLSEDTQSTKEMKHEMNAFIEKLNKVSFGDAKESFVNLSFVYTQILSESLRTK